MLELLAFEYLKNTTHYTTCSCIYFVYFFHINSFFYIHKQHNILNGPKQK